MRVRKYIKIDLNANFDDIRYMLRQAESYIVDQNRSGFAAGTITNIEQSLNALEFFMTDADCGAYDIRGYRKALARLKALYLQQFKKEVA